TSSHWIWKPITTPPSIASLRSRRWAVPIRAPNCVACASSPSPAASPSCACCRKAVASWKPATCARSCRRCGNRVPGSPAAATAWCIRRRWSGRHSRRTAATRRSTTPATRRSSPTPTRSRRRCNPCWTVSMNEFHLDRGQLLDRLTFYDESPDRKGLLPERVLDVGAGTGRGTAQLKQRYPKAEVVAVDLALPMLRAAKAHSGWLKPFRRVCAEATALPFPDHSV